MHASWCPAVAAPGLHPMAPHCALLEHEPLKEEPGSWGSPWNANTASHAPPAIDKGLISEFATARPAVGMHGNCLCLMVAIPVCFLSLWALCLVSLAPPGMSDMASEVHSWSLKLRRGWGLPHTVWPAGTSPSGPPNLRFQVLPQASGAVSRVKFGFVKWHHWMVHCEPRKR